jgi:hypothetical protein
MGSPYLKSGEDIVLTTNRVSVDAVLYDVMLTSERIFFIDQRNARFEPRIIPLSAILSVQGGKTPAQDPAITLLFRTGEEKDTRQPLNLVFSQNPNENRKPERDNWVRSLIQLSLARQEKEEIAEPPLVTEITRETGFRPALRHGVAPEKVRPLSNVIDPGAAPAPLTVIPEEIEERGEIPARAAPIMPWKEERPVPEPLPKEPASDITSLRGTLPHLPAPPARVIIPQIIEELLPVKNTIIPPDEPEQAPVAGIDPEALFRAIPTAGRSMTITEEQTSSRRQAAETVPETGVFAPAADEQEEVPEIIKALHIGAVEPPAETETPDAMEISDAVLSDFEPESVPDGLATGVREIPESHITLSIPEDVLQEPVGHPATNPVFRREPAAAEPPPVRHPIPPAREVRPLRTTLTYAAVFILLIVLVAAGALLLFQPGHGLTDNPVTPAPTTVQVTTLPPVTVQITPQPSATTRITTSVPSLTAPAVPQAGVWVRVNSTANYFGNAGNTGQMQKVSGTGDQFYKVLRSDRPVQVSVQKQDNSGALLTVAIYRDGTMIATRSITSPMGTADLLIDPRTGRAPGLTENDTLPEHAATPAVLENY